MNRFSSTSSLASFSRQDGSVKKKVLGQVIQSDLFVSPNSRTPTAFDHPKKVTFAELPGDGWHWRNQMYHVRICWTAWHPILYRQCSSIFCLWKSNKRIEKPYSFTISQLLRWDGNIYPSPFRLVPVAIFQLYSRWIVHVEHRGFGGRNVKKIGHARTQIDVVPYATTWNKYCKYCLKTIGPASSLSSSPLTCEKKTHHDIYKVDPKTS